MRLLELNGHRPRRSQPLLINAGFHTVEVARFTIISMVITFGLLLPKNSAVA